MTGVPVGLRLLSQSALIGNKTGVRLSSLARAFVDDVTIQGNCTGISSDTGSPLIERSRINGNHLAVRITNGQPGTQQPLPVIRLNDLSGNGSVVTVPPHAGQSCSGSGGTVLSSLTRPSGSLDLLDLTQNYWGETTPELVKAKVTVVVSGSNDPDFPLPFDVSEFLDSNLAIVGEGLVVSRSAFELKTRGSVESDAIFNPTDPDGAESGILEFYSPLDLGDTGRYRARVRVYPELAYKAFVESSATLPNPIVNVVIGDQDDGNGGPPDGIPDGAVGDPITNLVSWPWDGRDTRTTLEGGNPGKLMADEAYVVDLTIEDSLGPNTQKPFPIVIQPNLVAMTLEDLDPSANLTPGTTDDTNPARVFSGKPFAIPVKIPAMSSSTWIEAKAARIHLFALGKVGVLPDPCSGSDSGALKASVVNAFVTQGATERLYDYETSFRYEHDNSLLIQSPNVNDGNRPQPSVGEDFCVIGGILAGTDTQAASYVPPVASLYEPNLIIRGTKPIIRGAALTKDGTLTAVPANTSPDSFRIRVEPYVVRQSYDQVVHFDFCLSQDADVRFRVLKPGNHNTNAGINETEATLIDTFGPSAPPPLAGRDCTVGNSTDYHHVSWAPTDEPSNGLHTFIIEAQSVHPDVNAADGAAVYRGFVDLRP